MHIIERVKKHDSRNIEIKYTFSLDEQQRKVDYQTEMYLFVPPSLGITNKSYSSDRFYQDERNNIRIKTPQFLLRNLTDGGQSPVEKLKSAMEYLAAAPSDAKKKESFLLNIKIFSCVFKSALRDGCSFIINHSHRDERGQFVNNIINDTRKALAAFHESERLIRVPTVDLHLQEVFLLADEYICMLADKYIFVLLGYVEKYAPEDKAEVVSFLNELTRYREKQKIIIASPESDNEKLLYRMSSLKKIMGEVLYIKTMTRKEGRVLDIIIPGIAAGVAMSIATLLLYLSRTNVNEMTLTLFLCIVGIYIIKDRLKDWFKVLFSKHMGGFLYDFSTLLLTGNGEKLGTRRENFQFISPEKLPDDVARIRQRSAEALESARPGEQVLHTRRRIHLHPGNGKRLLAEFHVEGIHDIVRFNVGRFLERMDNPAKKLFILKKGCCETISGRRIYHLNMVLRFSSREVNELRRFRIILSRDGIERIDEEIRDTAE